MFSYLNFALWEAVTSLWRSRVLNALSIGTIMFAMFILGSFVFVAANLKKITIDWQEQIQFNIFLEDDIDQGGTEAIQAYLNKSFQVDKVLFISRKAARNLFEDDFETYGEVVAAMAENPFPASFQVTLLKGIGKDSFQKLKGDLAHYHGIEDIYYDEEIYRRLDFFAGLIQLAGWFFGSIMIFSSIFTISNVLKLTFFTRREEVDIMKLVGASRAYIRGPFIVEGVLIGLLGATLGVFLVFIGFLGLSSYLADKSEFFLGNLDIVFLSYRWILFLIFSGGVSGFLGSLISLHQFLEEHISYQ